MRRNSFALFALISLTTAVLAQPYAMTGRASPNPATIGTTISLVLESTSTLALTSGCGINEIRSGSPTGPVVYQPFICPFIQLYVSPGSPLTRTWNQTGSNGLPVPAGEYFIRITHWDQVGLIQTTRWFPVRIDDPAAPALPVLSATGFPTIGANWPLQITDVANPGSFYVMAASLTTDVGWTISPTLHIALDQDVIWNLAYPSPDPFLFAGFFGVLDANGFTNAPTVIVPPAPALVGLPLSVQAVVLAPGAPGITNALTTVFR
jgi:hypothetical protein